MALHQCFKWVFSPSLFRGALDCAKKIFFSEMSIYLYSISTCLFVSRVWLWQAKILRLKNCKAFWTRPSWTTSSSRNSSDTWWMGRLGLRSRDSWLHRTWTEMVSFAFVLHLCQAGCQSSHKKMKRLDFSQVVDLRLWIPCAEHRAVIIFPPPPPTWEPVFAQALIPLHSSCLLLFLYTPKPNLFVVFSFAIVFSLLVPPCGSTLAVGGGRVVAQSG